MKRFLLLLTLFLCVIISYSIASDTILLESNLPVADTSAILTDSNEANAAVSFKNTGGAAPSNKLKRSFSEFDLKAKSAPQSIVYPNPASDFLYINNAGETIKIFDITGKLKGQFFNDQLVANIDIRNLSKGLYLVKLQNTDGTVKTLSFVKR